MKTIDQKPEAWIKIPQIELTLQDTEVESLEACPQGIDFMS